MLLRHHFQGRKVKGQLAGGGCILWRPPAQLDLRKLTIRNTISTNRVHALRLEKLSNFIITGF